MTRAETIRAALATARQIKANMREKEASRRQLEMWIKQDREREARRRDILLSDERRLLAELANIEAQESALADFDF